MARVCSMPLTLAKEAPHRVGTYGLTLRWHHANVIDSRRTNVSKVRRTGVNCSTSTCFTATTLNFFSYSSSFFSEYFVRSQKKTSLALITYLRGTWDLSLRNVAYCTQTVTLIWWWDFDCQPTILLRSKHIDIAQIPYDGLQKYLDPWCTYHQWSLLQGTYYISFHIYQIWFPWQIEDFFPYLVWELGKHFVSHSCFWNLEKFQSDNRWCSRGIG